MNKFTSGTWEFDYSNADDYSGGQWYEAGPAIVRFPYRCEESEKLEAKANALLICAAPDLLEALEYVADIDVSGADDSVIRFILAAAQHKARAAIVRARGEA